MSILPYDSLRGSLYHPGDADDFFHYGDFVNNHDLLCAEMSRLAYVKERGRLSGYLARVGYNLLRTFGYGQPGTQVFIAKTAEANQLKRAIIAFRGTEPDDPSDIGSDADLRKTPWLDHHAQSLGEVHQGFAKALLADVSNGDILTPLGEELATLAASGAEIAITGHSLGAALATLTAARFCRLPVNANIKLKTFGSPLVGDAEFAANTAGICHSRYVDCCDLVTRIPPEVLGYKHTGSLIYIDRSGRPVGNLDEDEISKDRVLAVAGYLVQYTFLLGHVAVRDLADHAPINYVSGVGGLR